MESRTRRRWRKWGVALLLALIALVFTGCRTLKFYGQAISGQFDILARQEPVDNLLASTNTGPKLKRQLVLLQELRSFAERELDLKVDGHYRKYADLERPFVVWNVEAAREFSLEPKTWWYPMVGRLEYRGFLFKRSRPRVCRPFAQAAPRCLHGRGSGLFHAGLVQRSRPKYLYLPLRTLSLLN